MKYGGLGCNCSTYCILERDKVAQERLSLRVFVDGGGNRLLKCIQAQGVAGDRF